MIQSIIFDTAPEQVKIDGVIYPINYGYRTMMAIEIEMFGDNNDEQKMLTSLHLFYGDNIPPNIDEAMRKLLWFYRCGKEEEKKKSGAPASKAKSRRAYCFKQDAPLIYSAFRQQYGINLKTTLNKELHWWEFMAMFESLDDSVKMADVMYCRVCNTAGMSKKQKERVLRIRMLHQIKESNVDMDTKAKLIKRNADMKEYVRRRTRECIENK